TVNRSPVPLHRPAGAPEPGEEGGRRLRNPGDDGARAGAGEDRDRGGGFEEKLGDITAAHSAGATPALCWGSHGPGGAATAGPGSSPDAPPPPNTRSTARRTAG